MRILQLISSAGLYGAEQMVVTLSSELLRLGHQCTIGVFDNSHAPNTEIAQHADGQSIPVELIPCHGRADLTGVVLLRRAIRKHKIDVLHAHGYKADIYGSAAARLEKVALLATCHNWLNETSLARVYAVLDRWALRHFDRIVAVSDSVAEILRQSGVADHRISVIANGIKLQAAADGLRVSLAFGSAPVVGFVGRLSREKGVLYFLDAAAHLRSQNVFAKFVIVGDGPDAECLKQAARDLGLESHVQFLGKRTDMAAVYATLDILVLPSLTEGLPLVLLEALAAKRAVVASSVGGIPKVLSNEQTGLLVRPGVSMELAAAIARLIMNPTLRSRLGQAGHELVAEQYSAEGMAERYIDLYSTISQVNGQHACDDTKPFELTTSRDRFSGKD